MSTSSPDTCPTCGAEIPTAAPVGMCPRCLLSETAHATPSLDEDLVPPMGDDDTELMEEANRPKPPSQPAEAAAQDESPTKASRKGAQQFAPSVEDLAELFPELEILDLLGVGGMGAVYKARQPRLDRLVALKILSCPREFQENFALRFEREAQLLAKLNHPNIVTIYDFGEVERSEDNETNLFFFLMEFVDGPDLNRLIHDGGLEPQQALALVPQICDALQFAHDEGITHRDIKPANILVDQKGQVRIADFGLAKLIEGEQEALLTGLTMTGTSMGTPHYMAPEQWETPESVDHRADIFSLGVVFYEMLTGERPIGAFKPPSKKVPDTDERLDSVVLRALETKPEERYQQASEVKEAVTRVVSEPVMVASGSKSRVGLWLGIGAALVTVVGMVIWQQMTSPEEPNGMTDAAPASPPKATGTESKSGEAASNRFVSDSPLDQRRPGRLRGWGDSPVVAKALEETNGISDIIEVGIDSRCWIALRADGTTMSNRSEFDSLTAVQSIDPLCHAVIHRDGQVTWRKEKDFDPILPEKLKPVRKIAVSLGDTSRALPPGLLLHEDGTMTAFAMRNPPSRHREKEDTQLARAKMAVAKIENAVDVEAWSPVNRGCIVLADGSVVMLDLESEDGILTKETKWKSARGIRQVQIQGWGPTLGLTQEKTVVAILGSNEQIPKIEGEVVDLVSQSGTSAARTENGRWIAWGSPVDGAELNAAITSLSPTPQIRFYAVNEYKNTGLLWIEPPALPLFSNSPGSPSESEERTSGAIRADGVSYFGKPLALSKAEGIDDFVEVVLDNTGWVGLRKNGEVIHSNYPGFPKSGVRRLLPGFHSWGMIDEDGRLTIVGRGPEEDALQSGVSPGVLAVPDDAQSIGVVDAAWSAGIAIARLRDGSARVWGERYEREFATQKQWQKPIPEALENVVDVAISQDGCATLSAEGTLYLCGPDFFQAEFPSLDGKVVDLESGPSDIRVLLGDGRLFGFLSRYGRDGKQIANEIDQIAGSHILREGADQWENLHHSIDINPFLSSALEEVPQLTRRKFDAAPRRPQKGAEPNAGVVWIEPDGPGVPELEPEPAFPTEESEFREWLEGKIFQTTQYREAASHKDLFWISGNRLHWLGYPLETEGKVEQLQWEFTISNPGEISWNWWGHQRASHQIQISNNGTGFEKIFQDSAKSGAKKDLGIVRSDLGLPGRLRAAGSGPRNGSPDLSKVDGKTDLVAVAGRVGDWVALRANGQTISSRGKANFTGISKIGWSFSQKYALIDDEGAIRYPEKLVDEFPSEFEGASFVDVKLGVDHGIALTEDGRALVFGRRYLEQVGDPSDGAWYGTPKWPQPPPEVLEDISAIAVTTTHAATLKSDGNLSVFGWDGLLDLELPKELGKIVEVGCSEDQLNLLDANGRAWKLPLRRNPAPNQPVLGHSRLLPLSSKEATVIALHGECWLESDGAWRHMVEDVDGLLRKTEIGPVTVPVIEGGVFESGRFISLMWIDP